MVHFFFGGGGGGGGLSPLNFTIRLNPCSPPIPPPLSVMFSTYLIETSVLQICKYDIAESISREMSGDLEAAMLAIGKVALWFPCHKLIFPPSPSLPSPILPSPPLPSPIENS